MSRSWTSLPRFCGRCAMYNVFMMGTCGLLSAFLLTSCSPGNSTNTAESTRIETPIPSLTVPPNSDIRPPAPGMTGNPKTPDGLPALQAKGLNTKLFSQKLSDDSARIERLENAVQELRNDFDAMSPAIVRLVSIEGDIQNLIKQLDTLTGNTSGKVDASEIAPIDEAALEQPIQPQNAAIPAPPVSNMIEDKPGAQAGQSSVPAPPSPAQENAAPSPVSGSPTPETSKSGEVESHAPPEKAQSPPPAIAASSPSPGKPATDGSTVTGIRVGEHPDKVRIVLDVTARTSYTADLDNAEKILVVELPDAAWSAEKGKTLAANPLIASYSTEKSGDAGTRLIIQLKKGCTLSYKGLMNNPDGQGVRLIIDLAPAK